MIEPKELFKLAARNVRRNHVRTLLTVAAIAIGILAYLMSSAVIGGIDETSIRNMINAETAHIKIYDNAYYPDRKEMYLENLISNYEALSGEITSLNKNISVTARLKFLGSVAMPDEDAPCTVIGADPQKDGLVFNVLRSIVPYTKSPENEKREALNKFQSDPHSCLVGIKFADYIGVKPGDEILVSGRTMHGTYNADSYTIAGLVSSDNPGIDAFAVILPLQSALVFADTGGRVSEIDIKADSRNPAKLNIIKDELTRILPAGLSAYTWEEELSDILTVFKIRRLAQKIIIALLLIVAIAGIANTMLMAVFERTKEIGTLAAMGMKKREIVLLFLFEGMLIGIIGGIAAMVISAVPMTLLINVGIQVKGTEMLANIPVSSRIYGYIEWYQHILAFIIAALTAVFASAYPALKAARLNIAMILRSK